MLKSDIEKDTILELSFATTYSSAVYVSMLWLSENLTSKEILYLNLVMLRDIHHPFTFQAPESGNISYWRRYDTWTYFCYDVFGSRLVSNHDSHWKSGIERDTILEVSDAETYSLALHFLIVQFSWNLILKEILYLNLVMLRLIHQTFTLKSCDWVEIWYWKRCYTWTELC